MKSSSILSLVLSAASFATAAPTTTSSAPAATSTLPFPNCNAPTTLLYDFGNSTFIENVAISAQNDILITDLSQAIVYALPGSKPNAKPYVLAEFPAPNTGVSGIAEAYPGVFAVAIGVWHISARVAYNQSVWTIDTNCSPPEVKFIRNYPNSTNLDGLAPYPGHAGVVFIADADAGGIYTLDVVRNISNFYADDSLSPDGPPPYLGVNGVKEQDSYLYYLNTRRGTYGKFHIDNSGVKNGPAEIIFTNPHEGLYGIDDFVLDSAGNAWIATHPNSVLKVTPNGNASIVATGPALGTVGPTAVGFARGLKTLSHILYSVQADGTVVAIDTSKC